MQLSNLDEFSALIRTIKSCSTGFLKKEFPECQNFAWQDGYGSFTVSYSQFERVRSYIQNQKEHHKQSTFEDEYLKLLESHQINDEMKYVFG
jgi:REP element-mobilizing transposase RayT